MPRMFSLFRSSLAAGLAAVVLVALKTSPLSSYSDTSMSALSAVRSANAKLRYNNRPVGIFLGGTSGIGRATALALAKTTQGNAHIILVGRNKAAADEIIASFPKHPDSQYDFISCDATLMKNVRTAASDILSRVDKINYLVLSPGYLTMKGRDETEEGIDRKLALNFYARWRMAYELIPLIQHAKDAGEDARVMSVLAAGRGTKVDLDDLGLKKGFSLRAAAGSVVTYTDSAWDKFAQDHTTLSFIHIYPGIVRTPMIYKTLGPAKFLAPLFNPITVSMEDCAEFMLYALTNKAYETGAFQLDNHAKPQTPNPHLTPEVLEKVSKHVFEATSGA